MNGFEWDEAKNRLNQRKHGISFQEAATIFEGPVLTLEDPGAHNEVREQSLGLLNGMVVILVIHTDRHDTRRIISARRATPNERKRFHAYLEKAAG